MGEGSFRITPARDGHPARIVAHQSPKNAKANGAVWAHVGYDDANGPIVVGQEVEPDPDEPDCFLRKGDFQ